jgi:type III pantothenate kinase
VNLTFDLGNTRLRAGLFDQKKILTEQAMPSQGISTTAVSFLRALLNETRVAPGQVKNLALSSVVPDLNAPLQEACREVFGKTAEILDAKSSTGISLEYLGGVAFGSDRLANLLAASVRFPGENILVADFGTATTLCVLDRNKKYRGGFILPGLGMSLEALADHTAQLPKVAAVIPEHFLGLSTVDSLQGGVFFQNLFFVQETAARLRRTMFKSEELRVVGTGGLSSLFLGEPCFDLVVPDLVLRGLNHYLTRKYL